LALSDTIVRCFDTKDKIKAKKLTKPTQLSRLVASAVLVNQGRIVLFG